MTPEQSIERDFLQAAVKRSQLLRAGEPLNEPLATALLEGIRDSNRGLPSLTAEMTLKEWKTGSIREYWS